MITRFSFSLSIFACVGTNVYAAPQVFTNATFGSTTTLRPGTTDTYDIRVDTARVDSTSIHVASTISNEKIGDIIIRSRSTNSIVIVLFINGNAASASALNPKANSIVGTICRVLRLQPKNPDSSWTPFMRAEFTPIK